MRVRDDIAKASRAAVLMAILAVGAQLSGCVSQSEMLQSRQPDARAGKDTGSERAVVAEATEMEYVLNGPGGSAAAFSGDGSRLLLAGEAEAQVWDTATWKRIGPVIPLGRSPRIALDEKGKRALITCDFFVVQKSGWPEFAAHTESAVWDVDMGKRLSPIIQHKGRSVSGPALSPDGKMVARIGDEPAPRVGARQAVHLLHADTMEEFRRLDDPMPWPSLGSDSRGQRAFVRGSSYFAQFNPERVISVRFNRDGSLMVMGSHGSIHKWDVEKVKVLASREFSDNVEAVTNNDRVLSDRIGGFAVREFVLGRELLKGTYYKYDYQGAQISDDGALVAVSVFAPDWRSEIWHVDSGKKLAFLPEFVVLHPRGGMVAASTYDAAGVWDVVSGKCIRKPKKEGYYTKAVFSPDGTRLVLTGSEGTVILLARPGKPTAVRWMVDDAVKEKK